MLDIDPTANYNPKDTRSMRLIIIGHRSLSESQKVTIIKAIYMTTTSTPATKLKAEKKENLSIDYIISCFKKRYAYCIHILSS